MKDVVRDLGETNTAIYSVTFSGEKTKAKLALKEPHVNPPLRTQHADGPIQAYNDPGRPTQGYAKLDEPLRLIFGGMLKNVSAEMASLSGGEAMSFDGQGELEQDLSV